MKSKFAWLGAAVMTLIASAAWAQNAVPQFQVDPFWPKPLPHNWVTGEVGGTCVDSQDHVFIVTRGFQTGGLTSPEGVAGRPEKSHASPPAIEFDQAGNVVNSWGDPNIIDSLFTPATCVLHTTRVGDIVRELFGLVRIAGVEGRTEQRGA